MKRFLAILIASLLIVAFLSFHVACTTTPLPVPPTVDPEVNPDLITIESDRGGALITGGEGAIEPPDSEIRVTYGDEPIDSIPPESQELVVGADGSFQAWVMGSPSNTFYIEFLLEDEDLFVMAISDQTDGPGVDEVESGPDSDGDGSPDRIDCAPFDETYGGQRCP